MAIYWNSRKTVKEYFTECSGFSIEIIENNKIAEMSVIILVLEVFIFREKLKPQIFFSLKKYF